jgi:hypothetical protein
MRGTGTAQRQVMSSVVDLVADDKFGLSAMWIMSVFAKFTV